MTDHLEAVAAALGAPEDLVNRSAAARAGAEGSSTEAVLAAWSGGTPLPDAGATPPAPVVDEPSPEPSMSAQTDEAPEAASSPAVAVLQATAPNRARSMTPVLEGQRGRPMMALLGIFGLFFLGLLVTLIIPASTGGDYNHLVQDAELSASGEAGLDVYLREGCWYCHTQLVRPVLADVGLGPATETFSDPLDSAAFGLQRIGPDLAHIGSRSSLLGEDAPLAAGEIEGLLSEPHSIFPEGLHPSYTFLSETDLAALTTYLLELK